MKIVEEYLNRHNHEIAYAKFVQCGSVFFKQAEDDRWNLMNIQWRQEPMWHPGNYRITQRQALKGTFDRRVGLRKYNEDIVEWKDYETYLRKWLSNMKGITENKLEATVAAWEVALFCCEHDMAAHAIDERVFQSVDVSLSTLERAEIIEKLQVQFANSYSMFAELWRSLRMEVQNHCNWLVALRNDVK